ncbi:HesA/MoeB/ThiF family protein [Wenzhouxiangella sp. AB-CW3]|uniref:HesA/MoeB/ThiF family protein n=1 Tax=Wenzhouxiangella sp. AB-CW3 TaxID=2771012 RepID=UPI00168B4DCB|nr:HesA/MoeB/ThiF family protein [Wenzhouxiangella sp. AB-CW3]QOC22459.1 HesA/MoeB/ThiF family protein [Wenzhouxiangella sp. AB-CW3]
MSSRYAKQTILPELGTEGQRRLGAATVLCIGAGGLGCASLPYLAAAGVGHIVIIDDDRVDLSNLQRQTLFAETDIGQPKAKAAAERLAAMNGDIVVEPLVSRLDVDNVESLFARADVVIDGSDNYATKYLVADASVKFAVPLVYGSATGMEAMVTVFAPDHGPCLRCLFPEPPTGWMPNCAEAGVLGPLVGMAGCIQAAEAIKCLVSGPKLESLSGRLWMFDARDMSSRQMSITHKPDCPLCSQPAATISLSGIGNRLIELVPEDALALGDTLWVDVREADEFAQGHVDGALNLPLSKLQRGEVKVPRAPAAIIYCQSGMRCQTAAPVLSAAGIETLYSLKGGFEAWSRRRW